MTRHDPAAARGRAAAANDAMTAELNELYKDVLHGSPAAKRAGESRL